MCATTFRPRSTTITRLHLNGLRILNTRPKHQAAFLSTKIHEAGGISIELPTLNIDPLSLDWMTHMPPLSSIQKAIFVSANAVEYFFQGLKALRLTWPNTIEPLAIGQATAQALAQHQITVSELPTMADSEHFLKLDALQHIQQSSILLVSGENSRPLIASHLQKKGAILHTATVYRRSLPEKNLSFTHALWQDDAVDIILMLSHGAIDNLFVLFEEAARPWIQSKPCIVISPRLADLAHHYDMQTVILSPYENLLTTLAELTHGQGRRAI
ncbi:MAG: uroporphyrinogen-III synthase [Legionella sp.]|nr:MAG: uroporphyrinogen-III synthase [Legionella sp.]